MNITVTGRSGRMGQTVIEAIAAEPDACVHSTHDAGEDLAAALAGADAVIDFTIHTFTCQLLEAAS